MSFNQLLIRLIQKRGRKFFTEEKRGADTIFLRKKGGENFFCQLKKGATTFFSQIKRGRRVFSPTKNPQNPARVPCKIWFVPYTLYTSFRVDYPRDRKQRRDDHVLSPGKVKSFGLDSGMVNSAWSTPTMNDKQ